MSFKWNKLKKLLIIYNKAYSKIKIFMAIRLVKLVELTKVKFLPPILNSSGTDLELLWRLFYGKNSKTINAQVKV